MRIPDLEFRLGGGIVLWHETIQKTLDDRESLFGFDVFGLLLLNQAVEGRHDMLGIIRIEKSISVVYRDVVLAVETMNGALLAPDLFLLEFDLPQFLAFGEVGVVISSLLGHPVDEGLETDDVPGHGRLRCSCRVCGHPKRGALNAASRCLVNPSWRSHSRPRASCPGVFDVTDPPIPQADPKERGRRSLRRNETISSAT